MCVTLPGCFLIGQIFFYSGGLGANRNLSGKLCMKLAMEASEPYQHVSQVHFCKTEEDQTFRSKG